MVCHTPAPGEPDNVQIGGDSGTPGTNAPAAMREAKIIGQMSPEEARDHAQAMTEAAEAAEQDAFIYDWVMNVGYAGRAVQAAGPSLAISGRNTRGRSRALMPIEAATPPARARSSPKCGKEPFEPFYARTGSAIALPLVP